jgi:transposase
MPRYRRVEKKQALLVPVRFADQIHPGTIEHAIDYIVDNEIDLSGFESRYRNDETGAPAIHPGVLLKIVLFGYSRGMVSSRAIARACEENVVFMALSADTRPHFTTIAEFISTMGEQAVKVFTDVLTVCYAEGLIERKMFAVDGCKISANCSKEWSGTRAELEKKAKRIEESVRTLLDRHRGDDNDRSDPDRREQEQRAVEHLSRKAKKIREFLSTAEERIGAQGKPVKSNVTDNESAKMPSSHGVIQGYTGIATVDAKHQVVVDAQVFGDGSEAQHVEEIIDSLEATFATIAPTEKVLTQTVLTADSGFNSEKSMKVLRNRKIDGYVADGKFRKRDPKFANQQEHKSKTTDRKRTSKARKYFAADEFTFDKNCTLICPAGKPMKSRCPNWRNKKRGYTGKTYMGYPKYCGKCESKSKCMRSAKSKARQVTKIDPGVRHEQKSAVQWMIERFDSARGRHLYSRRMGTVEPVFANIRDAIGLDEFTLRGGAKVNTQWKLFCTVHNIGKLARYATIG